MSNIVISAPPKSFFFIPAGVWGIAPHKLYKSFLTRVSLSGVGVLGVLTPSSRARALALLSNVRRLIMLCPVSCLIIFNYVITFGQGSSHFKPILSGSLIFSPTSFVKMGVKCIV